MLDQFEYRLLSEISHKLDYAIRSAEAPPAPAPDAGAQLNPQALRALQLLMTPCPPEVLHQRIMDAMAAATGAERGFLMMIEDGRKLRFKCGLQMDQQTIQRESGYSRSIIKQVVSTGDPVLIADSSKAVDSSDSVGNLNTKSILCVPLLVSGGQPGVAQVGGIAYLDARAVMHCFGPEELECARITAEMAVHTLEGPAPGAASAGGNAPSVDGDKLQQNFERLLDVGRTISSTLVLDDLLELVIEKVLEVTRADRGFLMLIEADDEKQEPQFKIGLTWNKKDGDKRRKRKLDESQFFFSSTVTKKALETKRPVVLNDIQASMGGSDPSVSMMQMELSSVMVAPLIEKGKILGLIYVDSKMSNGEFGESDVELFEALAGQAAIGLKNAMLYTAVSSQQRLESELALASKMQQDLCPETVPEIQGIELVGYMTPAREVGGDYYDFVEDDDAPGQVISMVVGDVSGKGLGAGIVAVMARCFLRSMLSAYGMDDPNQLLGYLNHTLCGELKAGKFMTMLLMMYDARRSVVRYAAAGHENIIIWRAATGSAEVIMSGGSPLGLSTTTGAGPTANVEIHLATGDTLVTYTDGVTEAMDMEDNEYELERLLALVNRMGGQSPQVIMDGIIRDLGVHRGEREVTDDITMVLLRKV